MGVLRITQALLNDFNLKVNHKRVYRLMKELDIQGEGYRKKSANMIPLKVLKELESKISYVAVFKPIGQIRRWFPMSLNLRSPKLRKECISNR